MKYLERQKNLLLSIDDARLRQVIRRHFYRHSISNQNANISHPHLSTKMCMHVHSVLQHDAEGHVREEFFDFSVDLDRIFFGHKPLSLANLFTKIKHYPRYYVKRSILSDMNDRFKSCLDKQERVKSFFAPCCSPTEKYQKIITLGQKLPPYPEEELKPENLVSGCQSQVYLLSRFEDGRVLFYVHADALISAGLAALLIEVYSDEPPEAILSCPPDFLDALGIHAALTPGRSHGLASIHLRMKKEAVKFLMHK